MTRFMNCLQNLPDEMAVRGLPLEIQINFEAVFHPLLKKTIRNTNTQNTIVFIRFNTRISETQRLLPYNPRHSMQCCTLRKVKLYRACACDVAGL